jgi:hypothetical protein
LLCDSKEYAVLKESLETWHFENYRPEVEGLFASLVEHPLDHPVRITISKISKNLKEDIKGLIKKKSKPVIIMEEVNDRLLELVILHYRNSAYSYEYDRQMGCIQLIIHGSKLNG